MITDWFASILPQLIYLKVTEGAAITKIKASHNLVNCSLAVYYIQDWGLLYVLSWGSIIILQSKLITNTAIFSLLHTVSRIAFFKFLALVNSYFFSSLIFGIHTVEHCKSLQKFWFYLFCLFSFFEIIVTVLQGVCSRLLSSTEKPVVC